MRRFTTANRVQGVRQVEPQNPAQRAAVSFFAQRNVPVYLVEAPDGSPLRVPAMWSGDGVVIDANAGTPEYTRALVYHEAFHDLKRRNPAAWKKAYEAVRALDPEGLAAAEARYFANADAAGVEVDRAAMSEEEALSAFAEGFSAWLESARNDPDKIRRLAEQNPRTLARVLDALQRALKSVGLFDGETILERRGQARTAATIALELNAALDTLVGRAEARAPSVSRSSAQTPGPGAVSQDRDATAQNPRSEAVEAGSVAETVAERPNESRTAVRERKGSEFSNLGIRRRLHRVVEQAGADTEQAQAERLTGGDAESTNQEFIDTNFPGPLPAEVREALEGLPPNIRTRFKGNMPGGAGEDVMAAIGVDEMIRRVRLMVEGRDARVERYLDEVDDPSRLSPDAGMLLAVQRARAGKRADSLNPSQVLEHPAGLDDGATFQIEGGTWVVTRRNGYPEAVGEDGADSFTLDGVEAMPIDAKSLRRHAGAAAPVAEEVDLPFALRDSTNVDGRPYARVPDSLMGFRRSGENKGFNDQAYRHTQGVRVTFDDGRSIEDAVMGLNREHALERARRNWEGATVEPISRGTFDPENPDIRFATRDDPKAVSLLDSLPDPPAPSRAQRKFFARNSTQGMFNGIDPNPQSGFEAMIFNMRRTMQDKFLPILRVQQAVERVGGRVSDDANAYRAETLYYGRAAEQSRQLNKRLVEPLFRKMNEAGVERGELDLYLYAKHAPERNRVIREKNPDFEGDGSGMSDADAAEIVTRFESGDKGAAFKDLAADVGRIRDWTLAYMVQNDLLSEAQAKVWRETYQNYVPLRTADTGDRPVSPGQGFQVRGKESKEAKGRKSLADSPLLFLIHQADHTIVRAERNRVGLALMRLIVANPDKNLWNAYSRKVARTSTPDMWGNTETEIIRNPAMPDLDQRNTIVVKEKGEERYLVVNNPDLVRAMKNMGTMQLSGAVRLLQGPMRFLSGIVTTWSPEFILTNFVRDIQTAGINVAAEYDMETLRKAVGLRAIGRAMAGAWEATRAERRDSDAVEGEWAKTFREFVEDGGKTGWAGAYSFEDRAKDIERTIKAAKDDQAGILKALIGVKNLVEDANTAVENAVRVSLYAELRRQGMPRAKAAEAGKNLTVNFNRKGEAGAAMNTAYMFYNAGIQGSVRTLQAVNTRRGRKIALGIAGFGALMNFLNAVLSDEDDDGELYYDKISPWIRSHNFIVMLPGTGGRYIKIPMPYGYNAFHAFGTHTASVLRGEQTGRESAGHIAASVLNSFNPIGGGFSFTDFVPTLGQPFAELAVNKDFAGRPINPQRFRDDTRPDSEVYFQRSSLPAREVAQFFNRLSGGNEVEAGAFNFHPGTVDHWANFFTGSAGKFVVDAAQSPIRLLSGEGIDASSTVFTRRFLGQPAEQRHESRFWRNKGEADALLSFERRYLKSEEPGRVEAFRAREGVKLDAAREIKVYAKVIDDLLERQSDGDERVTDADIDALRVEANRMVRAADRGEPWETPLLDGSRGVTRLRRLERDRIRQMEREAARR